MLWWLAGCGLLLTDADVEAQLDVDGDGFLSRAFGGDDCDEGDPSVYPGAPDVWYDGVDADCAGDDDYDQDRDGLASALYGGLDCDDEDPLVGDRLLDWFADCDGDGVPGRASLAACSPPDDLQICGGGPRPPGARTPRCSTVTTAVRTWPRPRGRAVRQGGRGLRRAQRLRRGRRWLRRHGRAGRHARRRHRCGRLRRQRSRVNPAAAEVWYDGVDADCDGRNDYDADGDTFVAAGFSDRAGGSAPRVADCNDTLPGVHPGAASTRPTTAWTGNCDGRSDYDADGDGDGWTRRLGGPGCGGRLRRHLGGGVPCAPATEVSTTASTAGLRPRAERRRRGRRWVRGPLGFGGTDCNDLRADAHPGDGGGLVRRHRPGVRRGRRLRPGRRRLPRRLRLVDADLASAWTATISTPPCIPVRPETSGTTAWTPTATGERLRPRRRRRAARDLRGQAPDCDDLDPTRSRAVRRGLVRRRGSGLRRADDYDQDGDGYPRADGATDPSQADCDDLDPAIHPGAPEILLDGIDQVTATLAQVTNYGDFVARGGQGGPAPRRPFPHALHPTDLAVDPAAGLAADPALGETVGHLP
ncbi:MAG: putative metal-binding motif-containing protein [Alphaproteobacteria bacterium]|nr:putative metal-binding motif-containing protein [Alphaproteobacteria bacterium]